ncbi:hypothetical protein F7734_33400 [Scytonema sp. UIC 10036]|uniref:hypothetical protein n=1 Tax=Scytonema sp. UIC 10036 TaxID=2304196 RepID=UPI0012DAE203|nr:hypothetical protein [Scytonema sp. UIC 10036]MUG96972.1 hypothetical protein [Scytonema sp. UIC 10036]
MTTVIFIHGTGVRGREYEETFKTIEKKIYAERPDVKIERCLWGDKLGTSLLASGASIPRYDETLALDEEEEEDKEILRWKQLYCDPLYELRLLLLKPGEERSDNPFAESPLDELRSRVDNFTPSDKLQAKLAEAGITEVFGEAREAVIRSNAYNEAWDNVSAESLGEYSNVISRAIAAQAMLICYQQEKYAPVLTNAKLRDQLVELLSLDLAEAELGLGDWALEQIARLALPIGTNYVVGKRGAVTNKISPMPCDILLYQARGGKIRDFIRETIAEAEPPVVLLAHSLGGIACVDLLVEQSLPKVAHLVTVGSQVPFLYEINALCSLEFGQPLPEHFPEWLNIYDLRDFLSYKGSQIFPKVRDELVNSKQPFPRSHSAYWEQDKTWEYIMEILPR